MTDITPEQRANLTTLAAYLRTLPPEYPDFAMRRFTNDGRGSARDFARVPECGTAACAAGHGPVAGIPPLPAETWLVYSSRAFVDHTLAAWNWCFAEHWAAVDNTAHGAAGRIELLLADGLPDNWEDQLLGYADLSYETPESIAIA